MGGDWYWALGALVNLSSMVTGNSARHSKPRSGCTFMLEALGRSCVSDLAGHQSTKAAFYLGTNMLVQGAMTGQSAVKGAHRRVRVFEALEQSHQWSGANAF